MSEAPVTPRRFDRWFRWRGRDVSRLEAFSDAVFALVIALLFLQSTPPTDGASLAEAMKSLLPFAITFALLALVWSEHYLFFRRYDLRDAVTITGNFVLLFLVLFYAHPLKFVFTWIAALWLGPIDGVDPNTGMAGPVNPIWFYSAGFAAIYVVYALLYWRAWALRDALRLDASERLLTASGIVQSALYVAVALVSLSFAALDLPGAAGLVFFALGPIMGLHGYWQGNRLRRLGVPGAGAAAS